MANKFVDYETKVCADWLNTVDWAVFDALGSPQTPSEARNFIGAIPDAPDDGETYVRRSRSWVTAGSAVLHNQLLGRDAEDCHPIASITSLQATLDAIDSALSGKADGAHLHPGVYLELAGGTMLGDLILSGDPLTDLAAATKQYVDQSGGASYLQLTGGTMTGAIINYTPNPTDPLELVCKSYVDDAVASGGQPGTFVLKAGDTMTGALGLVDGATAAPALFFANDTDTGIFRDNTSKQIRISFDAGTKIAIDPVVGAIGMGTTALAGYNIRLAPSLTGASSSYCVRAQPTIQSDVTSSANIFGSTPGTTAATFNIAALRHFYAYQGTIGAGTTIGSQYGFMADPTLIAGGSNYGFYGGIPAGTNRWNLYMNGTAGNYLGGSLGLGTTSLTGYGIACSLALTGSTTCIGILSGGQMQSDCTQGHGFRSGIAAAANANVSWLFHYRARQGTFAAGAVVANQVGYNVDSSLSGAAGNYGFYGEVVAGANNYNLYMPGSANNYLSSALGIGTTTLAGMCLRIGKAITGATTGYSVISSGAIQSDVTVAAKIFQSQVYTQAASFTCSYVYHFAADQGALGAGSAITNQFGFAAGNGLTGAANNYGFYGAIPAGANRWNLYMAGDALNYLAGALLIGSNSDDAVNALQVTGTARASSPDAAADNTQLATTAWVRDLLTLSAGDHSVLINRDLADQHPTAAITGLDTALAGKQATITGAATTVTTADLTASRALISNSSGKIAVSSNVSDTELGYLDGVTSAIQTQINALKTFGIHFSLDVGANGNYVLDQYASFGYTINSAVYKTDSGTIVCAVQIDGTAVTGLSALSIGTTEGGPTNSSGTTANKTVDAGDTLRLVLSSNSSAAKVNVKLNCTRT